jgi:hypothetical protein
MERKAAKKSAAKKKAVEPKTAEIKSPFDEVAADPPAANSTNPKSVPKKRSLPRALATGASPTKKPAKRTTKKTLDVTAGIAKTEPKVELSPVFKALAEPKLPELPRENRARLMMQTPTHLYFYWSVRENPYQLLHKAFGDDTGSYTLVLKLTELNRGVEEIHPVEAEGNWWFAVEPNGKYQAEIGFYAPNRPYFRIVYSNTVETPRRNPSPHPATDAHWRVPAHKFAEVLDVAGFSQDAFDVAMAGDDHAAAEDMTHAAFTSFIGRDNYDLSGVAAEDIRYSLTALAAGSTLEEIRSRISPTLFAILQANAEKIAAGNAASIMNEYFDIDESEFTEHQHSSAVHGASLVNFPRTRAQKFSPVGSHTIRHGLANS